MPDPDSAESEMHELLNESLRSSAGSVGCDLESGMARSSVHWGKEWRAYHRRVEPAAKAVEALVPY